MPAASETVRRWFQAVDGADVDGATALLGREPEFAAPGLSLRGPDEIRGFLAGWASAMSACRHSVELPAAVGGVVAVEGRVQATHTGPLVTPGGEVPATGRTVAFDFASVFRLDKEKIVSIHAYWDNMTFMAQLGLLPERAAT